MEEYSQEIVNNIKHEPEVHFTCYLPDDPETDEEPEVKEIKIVLRKFDKTWKNPAKLFGSYFACGKCEFACKSSGDWKKHLKVCKTLEKCESCCFISKSREFIKCCFCDKQFDCSNCKSNHISQDHCKDSSWLCFKCDYRSSIKNHLRNHYQIHVKKFTCQTSSQNFSRNYLLSNHQKQYRHGEYATEPEIKFECPNCSHSFLTEFGLRKHERSSHSKTKFHCDFCGKASKTKNQLQSHIQTHFKVRCPICHHLLAQRHLQPHIEKHTAIARFKCDACNKLYFNRHDLNIHKSRIHEIDQVQCDLCQKIFKNKLMLRLHMRNHLKVSCPTCSKSMSKAALNQHMRMHSTKRESLVCNIVKCRQKFLNTQQLEDHRKIHIGPNYYKCPNCNHQTKTLHNMKRHIKCHSA